MNLETKGIPNIKIEPDITNNVASRSLNLSGVTSSPINHVLVVNSTKSCENYEAKEYQEDKSREHAMKKGDKPLLRTNIDQYKIYDDGSFQLTNINRPHHHDVLCGRGNYVNYHPGNEYYRSLVKKYFMRYVGCSKTDKPKFALLIYHEIRTRVPPGRFLKLDSGSKLWNDIGEKKAIDKTRQALREGAPEANTVVKEVVENFTSGENEELYASGEVDSSYAARTISFNGNRSSVRSPNSALFAGNNSVTEQELGRIDQQRHIQALQIPQTIESKVPKIKTCNQPNECIISPSLNPKNRATLCSTSQQFADHFADDDSTSDIDTKGNDIDVNSHRSSAAEKIKNKRDIGISNTSNEIAEQLDKLNRINNLIKNKKKRNNLGEGVASGIPPSSYYNLFQKATKATEEWGDVTTIEADLDPAATLLSIAQHGAAKKNNANDIANINRVDAAVHVLRDGSKKLNSNGNDTNIFGIKRERPNDLWTQHPFNLITPYRVPCEHCLGTGVLPVPSDFDALSSKIDPIKGKSTAKLNDTILSNDETQNGGTNRVDESSNELASEVGQNNPNEHSMKLKSKELNSEMIHMITQHDENNNVNNPPVITSLMAKIHDAERKWGIVGDYSKANGINCINDNFAQRIEAIEDKALQYRKRLNKELKNETFQGSHDQQKLRNNVQVKKEEDEQTDTLVVTMNENIAMVDCKRMKIWDEKIKISEQQWGVNPPSNYNFVERIELVERMACTYMERLQFWL